MRKPCTILILAGSSFDFPPFKLSQRAAVVESLAMLDGHRMATIRGKRSVVSSEAIDKVNSLNIVLKSNLGTQIRYPWNLDHKSFRSGR
jgi:hypothetical protein